MENLSTLFVEGSQLDQIYKYWKQENENSDISEFFKFINEEFLIMNAWQYNELMKENIKIK